MRSSLTLLFVLLSFALSSPSVDLQLQMEMVFSNTTTTDRMVGVNLSSNNLLLPAHIFAVYQWMVVGDSPVLPLFNAQHQVDVLLSSESPNRGLLFWLVITLAAEPPTLLTTTLITLAFTVLLTIAFFVIEYGIELNPFLGSLLPKYALT